VGSGKCEVGSEEIVGSGKCEVGSEQSKAFSVSSEQENNNQEKLVTGHWSLVTETGNTGNIGNNQAQTVDLQNLEPVTNSGNNTGNNTVTSEQLPVTNEQNSSSLIAHHSSLVFNYDDLIADIDLQMQRLGWTIQTGQDYILKTYGTKSRQTLTDEQLLEFLDFLKLLPTDQDSVTSVSSGTEAVLIHSNPNLNGKRVIVEFVKNAVTAIVKFVDDLTTSFEVPLIQLKPIT
jgi:hypothetical protein